MQFVLWARREELEKRYKHQHIPWDKLMLDAPLSVSNILAVSSLDMIIIVQELVPGFIQVCHDSCSRTVCAIATVGISKLFVRASTWWARTI